MKIIFMGTPEFAVASLAALVNVGEIIGVVTQPDRPKGRGHKMQSPPVKLFALEHNLRVIQPVKIKTPEAVAELEALKPDLIVVAAYGQILSQKILDIPRLGCINVHASLLPKYRGAAPIEWSLINGESVTGITTMRMDAGLDTGDILLRREVGITEEMILPELRERLMTVGAELLIETLKQIHRLQPLKQDDSRATYAPLLKKDTGLIDWHKSARTLHNLIRGLYGGAFTFAGGDKFKIYRTRLTEENLSLNAGQLKIHDGRLYVGTGSGVLEILEMQAPNAKKLTAAEYLRGHKIGGNFWTSE